VRRAGGVGGGQVDGGGGGGGEVGGGTHLSREAKVADLERVVVRDEDVGGGEVTVDEARDVDVLQPAQQLQKHGPVGFERRVAPRLLREMEFE